MSEALVPAAAEPAVAADGEADVVLPALIVDAGPDAVARFLEFFAGRIWVRVFRNPPGSVLATGGDLVFVDAGGTLYALDAATGYEIWKFRSDRHVPTGVPVTSERREPNGRVGSSLRIGDDVAEPNQRPLQGHARRVRTRQTFDEGELPVGVSELGAANDEPPLPGLQAFQAVHVPPPGLDVPELLKLGRAVLGCPKRLLRRDDVATSGRPAHLVADPVLDASPKVDPQRAGAIRLELVEPYERVVKRVLNEVAGVEGTARPRREPAPHAFPEPGPIALEQGAGRPGAALLGLLEEA